MADSDKNTPPAESPASEAQWKEWALTVFGGNELRATAAARAAMRSRERGHTPNETFIAAKTAYEQAKFEPGAAVGAPTVVAPSGGRVLRHSLTAAVLAGVIASVLRFGVKGLFLTIVAAIGCVATLYALSMRCKVIVQGQTVRIRGRFIQKTVSRLDVRQITVQPWTPWWGFQGWAGANRRFVALVIGNDERTLATMRLGAWTRSDIDRVGELVGVRVNQHVPIEVRP